MTVSQVTVKVKTSSQTSLPSNTEIDCRVTAAQRIVFDVDEVTAVPMKDLIKAHTSAIGSPIEFIFFPLLTIALHFMGPETRVMANEGVARTAYPLEHCFS